MSISIDALSAARRASQVAYEQLSERHTLSCGIAFYSHEYAALPWANQVREVVLPPGVTMAQAYEEVEAFYAGIGLLCHRWVPASTQPPEPIEAFLVARGYTIEQKLTMLLTRHVNLASRPEVRIVPGRAMRKAYGDLIGSDERYPQAFRDALVASQLSRLDDPQYDLLLALRDGKPVGHGALFQVGDIARIENLYVIETARGRGAGLSLMAHLVALTRRLAMRLTCIELLEADARVRMFYERCGFDAGPSYVEFHSPAAS